MVPNVSRGYSFKGVTAYLLHDKREHSGNAPEAGTAERVGFTRLYNFRDEARTPEEAAKVMAFTAREADRIKRDAGVAATGGKATAPPVLHGSLSWAKSEAPTQAEKEAAVHEALQTVGLGVDKGFQIYLVEHTDTEHSHVHFVVNLVHPLTGKQANPHRDQPKLQSWARAYERRRGAIFCRAREAKYARLDRARETTSTRAAFNDNSRGPAPAPKLEPAAADRFGRSRERKPRDRKGNGQQQPEWQARSSAGNDDSTAGEAADRIKAETAGKWAALKGVERAAFAQRNAESARFHADRKAGRDAIFEKYRVALDAVWKPPASAGPDRSALWRMVREQQALRRQTFERNERSALGRLRNALTLAGRRASLLRIAWLALDRAARRRLFERGQRAIVARTIPQEARQPAWPRSKAPPASAGAGLPKRAQAEGLKAQRAAELAEHARQTAAQRAAMKARHGFQMQAEKDARAMLSRETGDAWQQHRETYGPANTADARRERKPDRFGRSRDRQRRPRRETGTGHEPAPAQAGENVADAIL